MSGAWLVLTKRLHQLGGGPLPSAAFDTSSCSRRVHAIDRALDLGVMTRVGKKRLYVLTPLGVDLCEGRAKLVRGGGASAARVLPVVGDAVPLRMVQQALAATGHQAGDTATIDMLATYSNELVRLVRKAVPA